MTSTLEREEVQVRELFRRVDEVIGVARKIENEHPTEAATLRTASKSALDHAAPVRVKIAANLLLVSDRTVRSWVNKGLLRLTQERPRRLLEPSRLHDVVMLLQDLRAAGQNRDLVNQLWYRLQDEALLDRDDLAESLVQVRKGKVKRALTLDEERGKAR